MSQRTPSPESFSYDKTLSKDKVRTHGILLLVVCCWGLNNIFLKIGFQEIDPWMYGFLRILFTMPLVFLFSKFSPASRPFEKRDFLAIAGISLVGFAGFQTVFLIGISKTSVPVGGILMATMPVQVLLIHMVTGIEKTTFRAVLGIVLTLAGVTVISLLSNTGASGETSLDGVLLVVLAELFFAINSVFLRPFMKKYSVSQVTSVGITISLLLYLIILNKKVFVFPYRSLSLVTWGCIAYSGLIALFFANLIWNLSIKKIGSLKVSVYANLPPVFVIFFGWLLLGEGLSRYQFVGAAAIFCGILTVQFSGRRIRREAS